MFTEATLREFSAIYLSVLFIVELAGLVLH